MKLHGRMIISFLVVIGLSLPTSCLYARSKDKNHNGIGKIHQQLNLSPEQDKQLQAHRDKYEKQQEDIKESIRAKKKDLKQELQKPDLNMEKINQLHSEMKVLIGQSEDNRLEGILEVRKILTPEQLTKFLDLIERHRHSTGKKEKGRE